jgi:hypothetical protein
MTKDYIYTQIRDHFKNNYIWILESDVDSIYKQVVHNKVYAFRIIYNFGDDNGESYKFDGATPLDYRLVVPFGKEMDLVSIDGGRRYQWNKREILVIDPVKIRELKLNELGI